MKKILFTLFSIFLISGFVQAQCSPDMSHAGDDGIHPDSATGFAPAYADSPYSQTITVVIPADTCVEFAPGFPCTTLTFDSVIVSNVTGLPPNFSFACAPPNCRFLGNTIDCAIITGNPVAADTGVYPLMFYIDAYLGGFSSPNSYTIDYYKIEVMPAVGINEIKNGFASRAVPNPFSSETKIEFNSGYEGTGKLEVFTIFGQLVYSKNTIIKRGNNRLLFDGSSLNNGTYFYKVTAGDYVHTQRIVVAK